MDNHVSRIMLVHQLDASTMAVASGPAGPVLAGPLFILKANTMSGNGR